MSKFKKFLFSVTIILIVSSILSTAFLLVAEFVQLNSTFSLVMTWVVTLFYILSLCLTYLQLALMVGVFIFQIKRLGEYLTYYLSALVSLASFGGAFYCFLVLFSKKLEVF